jgi:hypothetical protein
MQSPRFFHSSAYDFFSTRLKNIGQICVWKYKIRQEIEINGLVNKFEKEIAQNS